MSTRSFILLALVMVFTSFVYPNPHRGAFTFRIESLEEEIGTIEMYSVNGQSLS